MSNDSDVPDLKKFDADFAAALADEDSGGGGGGDGSKFGPIPDGIYPVIVEQAAITRAKSSGNEILKLTLGILTPGPYLGRYLWHNNTFAPRDSLRRLIRDVRMCGLDIRNLDDLRDGLDRLCGARLEVTAKKNKRDYQDVFFERQLTAAECPAIPPEPDVDDHYVPHVAKGKSDDDIPF